MQENKLYKYSSSPHVKAKRTTRQIMVRVCIALIPALIMGIIYFGYMAAVLVALSTLSAIASEFIYLLITKADCKGKTDATHFLFIS